MTIKTLTTTLLLATSFLLFTACDSKVESNTIYEQNPIVEINITMPVDANNTVETNASGDDTTVGGNDDNTTTTPTVTLASLKLTIDKTTLNKDENTTVKVVATYSDNISKDVTEEVAWISSKIDAVKVTKQTLIALQDTQTTLQAKLNSITSEAINLNIYWEVNGHRLPPEPDKTFNDSTLLGIDVNDNGVRDDVERWIYETYKDKHPIHIDIAMQAGRAYKKVLETPERAKEIEKEIGAPIYCEGYYSVYADKFGDRIYIHQRILGNTFDKKYFNIENRTKQYQIYQNTLSGDSYTVPWPSEGKMYCDFNTSKYEE